MFTLDCEEWLVGCVDEIGFVPSGVGRSGFTASWTWEVFLYWVVVTSSRRFPSLFKLGAYKNLSISSILGSSYPFFRNYNFHCNLFDSEIEDLGRLILSITCWYLFLSTLDTRV